MRSLFGNLHTPSTFSALSGRPPGRAVRGSGLLWFLLCAVAGGLQAASLAWPLQAWVPPGLAPGAPSGALQIASLALLVWALRHVHRVRQAAWRAWVFATAWLTGTFWWLFISMHTYGGLPATLAVLAVLALAGALALYYALAAGLLARWAPRSRLQQGLLFAALWTLAELMRGRWFTGFPWGAGGYAQVDLMAAWAPWVGVYGMGAIAALLAYSLAVLLPQWLGGLVAALRPRGQVPGAVLSARWWPARWPGTLAAVGVILLWASVLGGGLWRDLGQRGSTGTGELRVWLLQGNIPQDIKFNPDALVDTLETYRDLAERSDARLTVLPETAFPMLRDELPPLLVTELKVHAEARDGDMLIGLFEHEGGLYYNSVISLGAAPEQHYRKQHRVPFGEFIPLRFVLGPLINDVLHIPMGDLAAGQIQQTPLAVAGQQVAANICYEDVFGEEIIRALPQATLLANFTNDAWYGRSPAAAQHNQISQLRALESGRMMLRATNTGVTAIIGADGKILQQLPQHQAGILRGMAQGYTGATPYVRLGNAGVWLLLIGMLGYAWLRRELAE